MTDFDRDPTPDPELESALRSLGPPPVEADWERLRRSVNERAALPLARRRTASRSGRFPGWARAALPAAAAATVALAVLLPAGRSDVPGEEESAPAVAVAPGTPMADPEMELLYAAVGSDEAILQVVFAAP